MKRRSVLFLLALLLVCSVLASYGQSAPQPFSRKGNPVNSDLRKLSGSRVAIKAGEKTFIVDLYDNETANDLSSQLPLSLTADNYPGYEEKVIRLKKPLSMKGAPAGDDPEIPEFGYYHPGRWLAIYYGPIGYWSGKVPLGRINASLDELRAIPGNTPVTIERVRD